MAIAIDMFDYLTNRELEGNMMLHTQEVRGLVNDTVAKFRELHKQNQPIKLVVDHPEITIVSMEDDNKDKCLLLIFKVNGGTGDVKSYYFYPVNQGSWRLG